MSKKAGIGFLCLVSCSVLAETLVPELASFRPPVREIKEAVSGFLWVEAEDFTDYGAWRLDTQFIHKMGSAYLIATGTGEPIADAKMTVSIPQTGMWRVWARTKDWLPQFSPGAFTLAVNGERAKTRLGVSKREGWLWEQAGDFSLAKGPCALALCDLSGAFARCDALLLTRDLAYVPPAEAKACESERLRLCGLPAAIKEGGRYDVVVVGAGTAGMGAAIAAARTGAKTALVHDRPVLGGNASCELGVGTDGASVSHRNAREGGLNEEANLLRMKTKSILMSTAYRMQADGEKNLTVFSNQRVLGVEKTSSKEICSVLATDTLTHGRTRFNGKIFIDCTGDGWVGYYAGAEYRFGREGQNEFNEEVAPEKADSLTMSGCIMGNYCLGYRVKDMGAPVAYQTPAWAQILPPDFTRSIRSFKSGQWWMEHSGRVDDLADPERARDELLRITFAYWGWIKNGWERKNEARNYALDFIPYMDARRETRRLVGDYILTANDALAGKIFDDRISYGGWPLDTHDPEGMLNAHGNGYYSKHPNVPIYSIPYRTLYSTNIVNLFFAGRCQSVTHIALGSVRVEATLSTLGQAAGTAASLCLRHNVSPREFGKDYIVELQQQLLKDDQYIPEVKNEDPADLARKAKVTASSSQLHSRFSRKDVRTEPQAPGAHDLNMPRMVIFDRGETAHLQKIGFCLISQLESPVALTMKLRSADSLEGFRSAKDLAKGTAMVPPNRRSFVLFPVDCIVTQRYVGAILPPQKGVKWALLDTAQKNGGRAYGGDGNWTIVENQQYAFYTVPDLTFQTDVAPENAIDGVSRMVGNASHEWISDDLQKLPQWICLDFGKPVRAQEVRLTFDTDFTPTHPSAPMPRTLVKDYVLEIFDGKEWKKIAEESQNALRLRVHRFQEQSVVKVRLTVNATYGDPSARVFEIRVY